MTDRVTGWLAALAGAGAVLAAMTALSAPAAMAQGLAEGLAQDTQEARVAPPNLPAADVTGGAGAAGAYDGRTLDAFARATRIVGALRNEYLPKIAVANIAGRPERAEALFAEMRARMHDAIDATGLSIETYEEIASRAEHDRALRAQIEAIMTGAKPPVDPGLGVQAPQSAPITPVSRADEPAQDETALATAKDEIETLHRRLDTERSRARADRERAAADAVALRQSLEGAIERLSVQLEQSAPADEIELLRAAAMRDELAREALMREIAGLTRAFASAGDAMAALGADLSATPSPDVVPLARLEARPVLLAGSLPTLTRDLTAVQSRDALRARLDAEQTRNLTLRARHASERVALRREIDRIGRDLEAAVAALDELTRAGLKPAPTVGPVDTGGAAESDEISVGAGFKPARNSDPMNDHEVYAVAEIPEIPAQARHSDIMGPEEPALAPPSVPDASVMRTGTLQAGIRAYESKDFTRAYQVWEPLAEAGEAGAQFHLGALYFEGRGVRRDLGQARRWLRQALAQGEERARFLLGRVETQLAKAG